MANINTFNQTTAHVFFMYWGFNFFSAGHFSYNKIKLKLSGIDM